METWSAVIKEKGNDSLLNPSYSFVEPFNYIADKAEREKRIRKYLIEFWGLERPDVEWYKLEEIKDDGKP